MIYLIHLWLHLTYCVLLRRYRQIYSGVTYTAAVPCQHSTSLNTSILPSSPSFLFSIK